MSKSKVEKLRAAYKLYMEAMQERYDEHIKMRENARLPFSAVEDHDSIIKNIESEARGEFEISEYRNNGP